MTQENSPTLPPLTEPQTLIIDADVGSRAYTPWQMREYGWNCYEEGRKAALLEAAKALEEANLEGNGIDLFTAGMWAGREKSVDFLRRMAGEK